METPLKHALILFVALFLSLSAHARDEDSDELTFCKFGPKTKAIEKAVVVAPQGATDPCTGIGKIQGVMWECTEPGKVERRVEEMRERLNEVAGDQCRKLCAERAPGCQGKLIVRASCGLQTSRDEAVLLGKRFGCRKDCQGPAFSYCSLFDAGFRTEEPVLTPKQPGNCQCRPGGA
jgi:hypothetical protein